jgi:hypothetical protein
MLQPKLAKGDYVKKKRLEFDYIPPNINNKEIDVNYDMLSIISRLNIYHQFNSQTALWVIGELIKRKSGLTPKGGLILSIQHLSSEALLRLLNLKNCVSSLSTDSSGSRHSCARTPSGRHPEDGGTRRVRQQEL